MILKEELKIAIKAAIEAGKEILKVYESDFTHEAKDDESPLTLADKNANKVINSYLLRTDIPVISEENKQVDYSIRKDWIKCWIVDPLDGTKEFIKRNDEFTVNIALINNGKPTLGVVYVPTLRKLYYADVEEKVSYVTEINEASTTDVIVNGAKKMKPKKSDNGIVKVVGSRSHMNVETTNFIDQLKRKYDRVDIVSKGSSLKFCLIAEGLADVYPRFAPTMEWDTAAAHAICKASGINVTNVNTKKELSYNKENLLNPWFICEK